MATDTHTRTHTHTHTHVFFVRRYTVDDDYTRGLSNGHAQHIYDTRCRGLPGGPAGGPRCLHIFFSAVSKDRMPLGGKRPTQRFTNTRRVNDGPGDRGGPGALPIRPEQLRGVVRWGPTSRRCQSHSVHPRRRECPAWGRRSRQPGLLLPTSPR